MIKVFHMISTMNSGGAETMVKDYALLMDKTQFDVKIISLDKRSNSANENFLKEAGVPIVFLSELRYPAEQKLNIVQKAIRKIARYYDLKKIIKEEKPDILHVHLFIGKYLKRISLKKHGIKTFYTVHNVLDHYYDPSGKNRKKYLAYKEIKRLLKKEDLQLIALHDGMNHELREMFKTERVITVNNGINLDRFHRDLYDRNAIRKTLGIKEDAYVIGHVGRFHEQKNHDLIIHIFRKICDKNKDAYLLLIGEGSLRKQIEMQLREWNLEKNYMILQKRKDIPELMCAMDLLLFPSKWEGFGNVLVEAQSMELPCVVSDKITPNVIINSNVKVISLVEDVNTWVDAVMEMKKQECVVSEKLIEYDMHNSVKKLERLYLGKEK